MKTFAPITALVTTTDGVCPAGHVEIETPLLAPLLRYALRRAKADVALLEESRRALAMALMGKEEERDAAVRDTELLATEMVYHGNSVQWWHSKATAYKAALGRAWEALQAAGINSDGTFDVAEGIRRLAASHSSGGTEHGT